MGRLLRVKRIQADTLREEKRILPDERLRQIALLQKCETLWTGFQKFRDTRDRVYRFIYDNQWTDRVNIRGRWMTEQEYINEKGNFAFEVNLLKRQIEQISGLYTKEMNEPMCHARDREEQQYGELMATVLQTNWQINNMSIMYNHWIQELGCGGLAVAEECYAVRQGKMDAWTDAVPVKSFFMDCDYDDPRFMDVSLIGYFKDFSWKEVKKKYGIRPGAAERLARYYPCAADPLAQPSTLTPEERKEYETNAFYSCGDTTRCRVYEVWTKEIRTRYHCHDWAQGQLFTVDGDDTLKLREIEDINATRQVMYAAQGYDPRETPIIEAEPYLDEYWHYRHLTPEGYVLEEGDSQLEGGVHPFSICAIPFINGNISGFMLDKVNYQKAINRFLMLDDWVRRTGAKGLTMVDRRLLDGMEPEEFADAFAEIGGILFYTGKPGVETPKQFYSSTQSLDTTNMIQLFKSLLDDASAAASGALQGKTPHSGTSAALYAQQSQNASTGLATLYKQLGVFIESVARKKLCVIKATYQPRDYEIIAGHLANALPVSFDYANMGDIDYDLAVKQSTESPVVSMLANDTLKEMWAAGQISLEEYLKYSNGLWFADDLLQARAAEAQARQQENAGVAMEGGDPTRQQQETPQDATAATPGNAPGQMAPSPQPQMYGYGGRPVESR